MEHPHLTARSILEYNNGIWSTWRQQIIYVTVLRLDGKNIGLIMSMYAWLTDGWLQNLSTFKNEQFLLKMHCFTWEKALKAMKDHQVDELSFFDPFRFVKLNHTNFVFFSTGTDAEAHHKQINAAVKMYVKLVDGHLDIKLSKDFTVIFKVLVQHVDICEENVQEVFALQSLTRELFTNISIV